MFELLPAIDLREGRVVRLYKGDFERETSYGTDPVAVARAFELAGAGWVHLVDLDGARDGARRQAQAIGEVVAGVGDRIACQVAGGLRTEDSVRATLEAGARRVVVGTAALADPSFAGRLVTQFGTDRIVVALDVRAGQAVGAGWVQGARGLPVHEALPVLADQGVTTFAVTGIERDGTLAGPDVALLARLLDLGRGRIIASGGVSSIEDLEAVRDLGCAGAIVGRAIYEGQLDLRTAVVRLGIGGEG